MALVDWLMIAFISIITAVIVGVIHKAQIEKPLNLDLRVGFSFLALLYNQDREEYDLTCRFYNHSKSEFALKHATVHFKDKRTGALVFISYDWLQNELGERVYGRTPYNNIELEDLELVHEEYVLVDKDGNCVTVGG